MSKYVDKFFDGERDLAVAFTLIFSICGVGILICLVGAIICLSLGGSK